MYGREKGEREVGREKEEKEKEKEGEEKDDAAHRETVVPSAVVWRVDVSTKEMEVVRVRSIRISSSWPVEAIAARIPQWTST